MENKLQQYFPILKTKGAITKEIQENETLSQIFQSWTFEQQNEFLDFCSGARGIKFLYDCFFKEIMNPEYSPERLNDFLSQLLGKQVKILQVLPNDSTRIADEGSLLIMDIVVQLEDGTLANLEVQKIGYNFPGQRSACYSADLLLRQYKRCRSQKRKAFNYKDIREVYTIVFFEHSPKEFKAFPNCYCHYFQQTSNTGLELDLLQKYLFLPLDIFQNSLHNKNIKNKLDAWLMFFSSDKPEDIIWLVEHYPEFKPLYKDGYELCRNMERVMTMWSKELQQLDKNTVQYMIDEMQDTIDEQKSTIKTQQGKIETQQGKIETQQDTILAQQKALDEKDKLIQKLKAAVEKKEQ